MESSTFGPSRDTARAMSEEDVEAIIRRAHEAFNRRDREAFVALWTEDCEFRPALEREIEGDEGVFLGHDGIRRWWQAMSEAWKELESGVHEVRAAGEQALAFVTVRGRGRLSDAVIEGQFFQLVTVRGGKVLASRDFSDRAEALEAAGLSE
jgi:ketosteroid isomerase-like protein